MNQKKIKFQLRNVTCHTAPAIQYKITDWLNGAAYHTQVTERHV